MSEIKKEDKNLTAKELNESEIKHFVIIGNFTFELYADYNIDGVSQCRVAIIDHFDYDIIDCKPLFKNTNNAEKYIRKSLKRVAKDILKALKEDDSFSYLGGKNVSKNK